MGMLPRLLIIVFFIALSAAGIVFSTFLLLTAQSAYVCLIAVCFGALSVVSGFLNVVSANFYYQSYFYDSYLANLRKRLKPMRTHPSVAVAMPVYNEDPAMVARNLKRLKSLEYAGKVRYYLLDDSTDPGKRARLEAVARETGAEYVHRGERSGFKAGALNNLVGGLREEFIAVFDADEYLTDANFLKDLLPYFQDKGVAFVQTEKRYAKGTFFSDSSDLFDAIFFRFIQTSRALHGTAIFGGSCGIIRVSALRAMGGFPEYITEDTFFSFESDINSFTSVYVPQVYALGRPITTFTELAKQQWRYNYGDTQFLLYMSNVFRKSERGKKRAMPAVSKIDYVAHGFGLNYLSVVLIMFTVVSMLTVLAAAPFAFASVKQLLLLSHPILVLEILAMLTFSLSILTPAMITKIYFGSFSKGVMVFVLNFALSFTRLRAALAAVLNNNPVRSWMKGDGLRSGRKMVVSLRNSATELAFSAVLLAGGLVALVASNLSGALWLFWYAALYSSTFLFFFKYG
jgi:cellulose synthase (UDP-forming)